MAQTFRRRKRRVSASLDIFADFITVTKKQKLIDYLIPNDLLKV